MAAVSSIVAVAGLAVGVAGGFMQYQAQRASNRAQRRASDEAKKAQEEQRAQQYAQRDREQREQARAERIRRARVIQSAENTGTGGSSGAMGAVGALSTNLSSNMGFSQGMFRSAERISAFNQNAADYQTQAANHASRGSMWGQIGSLGGAAFGSAGGWDTLGAMYNK